LHIQSNHESTLSLNDQSNNIDIFATTEQTIKNKVIVPNLFENKDEVIAYVQSLNAEEAILLGNLWLQIKDKVTSLNHYEVILTANSEKEKAIREREIEVLNTKNKEIKELEKSISAKDRLILDNENKRKQSIEQLAKKEDEIKRYQASLQKKDDEIYTIRSSFNLERKELKLEKDKQLHEVQINISKQLDEAGKRNIELQSYIRAKEEELTKTREANENFMTNKFEATFGRFIEKSKTPAGTGLIGEEFVEQVLSKLGFGIHYENVAQKGHKGDFRVMFPKSEITILLEVKNLSETYTSLPRKDIDKFFKNLNDSSYHAGILLSLNSQCKMGVEDLSVQDDPKSKKKYMFLSKFISTVNGEHDFALRLALNVMANAVQASKSDQDDISKEMLSSIKSQLEFMRIQYKSAQAVEKEVANTVISLRDNIDRLTGQITEWETPKIKDQGRIPKLK